MNAYSQLSAVELNCLASMYAGIVKDRGVIDASWALRCFYSPEAITSTMAMDRLAALSAEAERRNEPKKVAILESGD